MEIYHELQPALAIQPTVSTRCSVCTDFAIVYIDISPPQLCESKLQASEHFTFKYLSM